MVLSKLALKGRVFQSRTRPTLPIDIHPDLYNYNISAGKLLCIPAHYSDRVKLGKCYDNAYTPIERLRNPIPPAKAFMDSPLYFQDSKPDEFTMGYYHYQKVIDKSSGEMISFAKWELVNSPEKIIPKPIGELLPHLTDNIAILNSPSNNNSLVVEGYGLMHPLLPVKQFYPHLSDEEIEKVTAARAKALNPKPYLRNS